MYKIYLLTLHPFWPMNGAGKVGLTVAGRELVFCCIDDYECSLANSSRICAT